MFEDEYRDYVADNLMRIVDEAMCGGTYEIVDKNNNTVAVVIGYDEYQELRTRT